MVLVIGNNGRGLMPTTERKARILLKKKKAVVVRKVPYTIRLLYKTGCAVQDTALGVDTGSQNIGAGIVSDGKALGRSEFALRSTMEKRSLNETRASYRKGRRYRKTRYRHPKYRPRTKRTYSEKPVKRNGHLTHWIKSKPSFMSNRRQGWLPSSIQSKIGHHVRIISNILSALPDRTRLRIEVGRFDVARIRDPSIHGELYQHGRLYDHENVKAYVFERDDYRCKVCNRKAGSKRPDGSTVKLKAHHIDYRSKGSTDNPDRMISVCERCHTPKAHEKGGILYDWMERGKKMKRGYRDYTFMNILRRRLFEAFPDAEFTYGNITSADRKAMGLEKTHANDAVAIASKGEKVTLVGETVHYRQVRHGKRSLHEANPRKGRKEPNRNAVRNAKNTKSVTIGRGDEQKTFLLFDRVSLNGETGWISGFTGTCAYVKNRYNGYVIPEGQKYNQVSLSSLTVISHNNGWVRGALAPIGKG